MRFNEKTVHLPRPEWTIEKALDTIINIGLQEQVVAVTTSLKRVYIHLDTLAAKNLLLTTRTEFQDSTRTTSLVVTVQGIPVEYDQNHVTSIASQWGTFTKIQPIKKTYKTIKYRNGNWQIIFSDLSKALSHKYTITLPGDNPTKITLAYNDADMGRLVRKEEVKKQTPKPKNTNKPKETQQPTQKPKETQQPIQEEVQKPTQKEKSAEDLVLSSDGEILSDDDSSSNGDMEIDTIDNTKPDENSALPKIPLNDYIIQHCPKVQAKKTTPLTQCSHKSIRVNFTEYVKKRRQYYTNTKTPYSMRDWKPAIRGYENIFGDVGWLYMLSKWEWLTLMKLLQLKRGSIRYNQDENFTVVYPDSIIADSCGTYATFFEQIKQLDKNHPSPDIENTDRFEDEVNAQIEKLVRTACIRQHSMKETSFKWTPNRDLWEFWRTRTQFFYNNSLREKQQKQTFQQNK